MPCLFTVNSCCGFPLKSGTKFIAVASLLTSLVMFCVYASLVVGTANHITEDNSTTARPDVPSISTSATTTPTTTEKSTTPTTTEKSTTPTSITTTGAPTHITTGASTIATTTTTKAPTITSEHPVEVLKKEKRSVTSDESESTSVSPEVQEEQVDMLMIYTVAMVMHLIAMVASSLLIQGIKEENASLMCMWLIWEGILLVFNMEELVRTSYQHQAEGVGHFVHVAINAYFWLVVMSYRLNIVEARGYQLNGGRKASYQELQNMESTSDSSSG